MKLLRLIPLFALFAGGAAFANTIQYDTSAGSVFNCVSSGSVTGCGTNTITIGNTVVLSYLPTNSSVTVDPINAPSTYANLGNIQISCVDNSLTCPNQTLPGGLSLSITINQSQPDFLSGGIPVGTVVGSIAGGSSNASIEWAPGSSVTLNGAVFDVTYAIVSPTLALSPPASCYGGHCGVTSIQGLITDPASVPEPAISMLFASGLVAIGSIRRRKKL